MVKTATKAAEAAGEDAAESDRAVDCLKKLESWPVTLQLLAATQAGKAVKKLSKSGVNRVAQAAGAVVLTWKSAVGGPEASTPSASQGTSTKAFHRSDSTKSTSSCGKEAVKRSSDSSGAPSIPKEGPKPKPTGDPTRDKGRQLFANSLQLAVKEAGEAGLAGQIAHIAAEIEEALFSQNGGMSKNYKAKFRSLNFNLKDPKNPDLRARVLRREHTAQELVTLSAEELASSARQRENQKIREHALWEAERGKTDQKATTDQFQCGKCKQRKTTYYQMQTRSADEPMTTFVSCVNCGNRWKFC